ncbi:MAG: YraN family protein [Deltaproteobacteria bacterium]|nr:YraN family protein [Deltaproteobacteria bacterium]
MKKLISLIQKRTPLTHSRGLLGEALAASYLKKQGYKILKKRFRYRLGEIDLIAQKKDQLAFVEVKTRSKAWKHTALEAIGPKKLLALEGTAYYFLENHPEITQCIKEMIFLALTVSLEKPKPKIQVTRLQAY